MFNKYFKKHIIVFSQKLSQSDNPFIFLKTVFVDGGYNTISKKVSYICIILHTSSYLLQMNYLIQHFSVDILLKYGCGILLMTYVSILK